jgi:hypothetical protein
MENIFFEPQCRSARQFPFRDEMTIEVTPFAKPLKRFSDPCAKLAMNLRSRQNLLIRSFAKSQQQE